MKPRRCAAPWIVAILLLLAALAPPLLATPYATCLTNHGSFISFRLNEAAGSVTIIADSGGTIHELGPLAAGLHTQHVTIPDPFQVVVKKTSGLGWKDGVALQISDDNNTQVKFWAPRGLAVNTDPASPLFGRVYVANAQASVTTDGTRPTTDGIYVLHADLTDAVAQGNVARTGGLAWAPPLQNLNTPWKIELGADGNLYIADWTTNSGGVHMVDGDVSPTSGVKVVDGYIGSSPITRGSLAGGDLRLYALEGLAEPVNTARLWNIGLGPLPYLGANLQQHDEALLDSVNLTVDLELGPDGKFYLLQNRFNGTEDGLIIADPNMDLVGGGESGNEPNGLADLVYSSLADTRLLSGNPNELDYLRRSRALKISPDGSTLAIVHDLGDTWIVPLVNGLPDLANRKYIPTGGVATGREVTFDGAGNLYVLNGGNERLRVFSAGLQSTATTGSDGTFNVTVDTPQSATVELVGTDVNIYERITQDTARLTINRAGPDLSAPLTVNLTLVGTAVAGVDYETIGTSVMIPANEVNTTLTVVGIDDDLFQGDKILTVSIAPGNYDVGGVTSATITIRDDETASGTVLWSDNFETDTSASYGVVFNEVAGGTGDFLAEFNYDYGTEGIPPAPHSAAGDTHGVKLQVNKDGSGSIASINIYPLGQNFSGDFAMRADMYISVGTDLGGQTEHSLLGIHHGGTQPNRHTLSSDGLWFAIDGDGSNSRGYARYQGGTGTPIATLNNTPDFSGIFTSPPWGFVGSPNNITNSVAGSGTGKYWAEAEISSIGGTITFKVNNTVIFSFENTSAYSSGTVMIGHNDQFASIGSLNNYTIFDNLRVVSFAAITIEIDTIIVTGGNVIIDFTADPADAPSAFTLRKSPNVTGTYTADAGAVFSERAPNGAGLFRATTPVDGASQFYFIEK